MLKYFLPLCILAGTLSASAANNVYFTFRPENTDYSYYYFFVNSFDSASILYKFGEVSVVSSSGVSRIKMANTMSNEQKVDGDSTQGEDLSLRTLARTETFFLPATGTIGHSEELAVFGTPCNPAGPSGGHVGHGWDVTDRSEFVVQLVNAATDSILAVLDSSGVLPGAQADHDTRYGANVTKVVKSTSIPSGHQGTLAYIRVSPRRYGPTPLGMRLQKVSLWVNLSATFDSTGINPVPSARIDSLFAQRFDDFLFYCDSVKAVTGWLPHIQYGMSREESDIYNNRYYDTVIDDSTGETYYRERASFLPKGISRSITPGHHNNLVFLSNARITSISPNPAKADLITLSLTIIAPDENSVPVQLHLMSDAGKDMGIVWSAEVVNGIYELPVQLPNLVSGAYLLILENVGNRQPVTSYKFIVSK